MEERLEKHITQYVETELENYRTYKKLIAEYDKELMYSGVKSGLAKDPSGRFAQNRTSDSTHNEVVRILANEQRIKRAQDIVACIEDVLEDLSEQDRRLVDLRYFQGWYTDYGIVQELHIGRSKYYEDKLRIVKKMALRMRLT